MSHPNIVAAPPGMRTLDGVRAAVIVLGLSAAACSSSGKVLETGAPVTPGDSGSGGSAQGNGGNDPGSGGGGNDGSGGDGAGGLLNVGGSGASRDAGSCSEITRKPEFVANDVLILLDQSVSMTNALSGGGGSSWWQATTAAISALVDDPGVLASAVGIQYFPLDGVAPASCAADYGTPDVALGLLPVNAGAVKASLASHSPNGVTPTGPALTGAIGYMKARAMTPAANGRNEVVVLVTDGFPTECEPQQLPDIAAIAADGKANGVTTVVVGLNLGSGGGYLDPIAAAGGTRKAVLVDQGDVSAQIQRGLARALFTTDCSTYTFQIPAMPSGTNDLVTVTVDGFTGLTETLTRVPDAASCTGSGFYVEGTGERTVHFCPATCDEPIASSSVSYGCR